MKTIIKSINDEEDNDLLPILTHVVGEVPMTDSFIQRAMAIWTRSIL